MKELKNLLSICGHEIRHSLADSGVLVFFLIVPLLYPLLYAYLYGQEVVREVPVVVVDECRSSLSREFLRKSDATPDLHIISYCTDMEEARELMRRHKAYGLIHIPAEFSKTIDDGRQATVNLYCDMSGLLYYKALLSGCTMVSLDMNRDIQIQRLGGLTDSEMEVQTMPIENEYVTMFNPANGFQGFIIPAILILIVQQTMVLGISMTSGTEYEQRKRGKLVLGDEYRNPVTVFLGKSLAYMIVYMVVTLYLLVFIPYLFHMPQLAHYDTLLAFMLPFLLACISMSMLLSYFVRDRESSFLLFVFMSVPLIFMSGISWPVSNMPKVWYGLSQIFPSTHGVNAYCRIIGDGAILRDIMHEYTLLWFLAAAYFILALGVRLIPWRGRRGAVILPKADSMSAQS